MIERQGYPYDFVVALSVAAALYGAKTGGAKAGGIDGVVLCLSAAKMLIQDQPPTEPPEPDEFEALATEVLDILAEALGVEP